MPSDDAPTRAKTTSRARWSRLEADRVNRTCASMTSGSKHKGREKRSDGPWVRWELEFKKDRAQLCVDLFAHLPLDEWREFTVGLLKSCISFRDTTADAPAWERCRSPELPWWKALTEGFTRCRFHVGTTNRKLEEVLGMVLTSYGAHDRGPLLCGRT